MSPAARGGGADDPAVDEPRVQRGRPRWHEPARSRSRRRRGRRTRGRRARRRARRAAGRPRESRSPRRRASSTEPASRKRAARSRGGLAASLGRPDDVVPAVDQRVAERRRPSRRDAAARRSQDVRQDEGEERHRDDAVHREEGRVEPAQVVGPDERVLVEEQPCDESPRRPSRGSRRRRPSPTATSSAIVDRCSARAPAKAPRSPKRVAHECSPCSRSTSTSNSA